MKKLSVIAVLTCLCLLLVACGGPNLNELKVHNVTRDKYKYTVDVSFDKSYKDVKLVFQSKIDNDKFDGVAESVHDIGDVETGKMYTEEVNTKDKWSFTGTLKQTVSLSDGGLDLDMPDMSKAKVKVIVKEGDKELAESEEL